MEKLENKFVGLIYTSNIANRLQIHADDYHVVKIVRETTEKKLTQRRVAIFFSSVSMIYDVD